MDHVSLVRAMRKVLRYPANIGRLPELYGDFDAPLEDLVKDAAFAMATPECLDWMNSRMGKLDAVSFDHAGVNEAIARFDGAQAGAPGKWGTPFLYPIDPSPVARVDGAFMHALDASEAGFERRSFMRFYVADNGGSFWAYEEEARIVLPGGGGERRVIARARIPDSDPRLGGRFPRRLYEPAVDGVFPGWIGDFWFFVS